VTGSSLIPTHGAKLREPKSYTLLLATTSAADDDDDDDVEPFTVTTAPSTLPELWSCVSWLVTGFSAFRSSLYTPHVDIKRMHKPWSFLCTLHRGVNTLNFRTFPLASSHDTPLKYSALEMYDTTGSGGIGSKELTRVTRPNLNDYANNGKNFKIFMTIEHLHFSLYSRHDMQTSSACHHNLAQRIITSYQVLLNGLGNQYWRFYCWAAKRSSIFSSNLASRWEIGGCSF